MVENESTKTIPCGNVATHDDLTLDQITTLLQKQYAAYILMTSSEPSEKGQMQIDMSYSGDETLVSYLVDSAAQVLCQEPPLSTKDSM